MNPNFDLKRFHGACVRWYQSKARALPWRELWRINRDPWHIWVSEIMLQQTVIKAVLPVYDRFLKLFPSPQDLASADTEAVRLSVRGLGYYRRFDLLHRAARYLIEVNAGVWPKSYEEWLNLPGIGDYTASAISSITLNEPHGVVDGNVERVLCRLLDIRTAPNLPELKVQFKSLMNKLAAFGHPGDFNQSVMELGQTVCTPTSPACPLCPVAAFCESRKNGSQALAPGPKARPEFSEVRMALLIPTKDESAVLMRRPAKAKFLRNTFGFPTLIYQEKTGWQGDGFELPQKMKSRLDKTSKRLGKRIKHNITKHKISADVITWDVSSTTEMKSITGLSNKAKTDENDLVMILILTKAKVEENLVSNLDRKAWQSLQ